MAGRRRSLREWPRVHLPTLPGLEAGRLDQPHPIQPGRPTQNGYVESFNGRLRDECLRINWFQHLFEARNILANWRHEYNEDRPHSSLNYLTPAEFAGRAGGGKDADSVRLKNDLPFFTFPPPRLRLVKHIISVRKWGHIWTRLVCKSFLRWSDGIETRTYIRPFVLKRGTPNGHNGICASTPYQVIGLNGPAPVRF